MQSLCTPLTDTLLEKIPVVQQSGFARHVCAHGEAVDTRRYHETRKTALIVVNALCVMSSGGKRLKNLLKFYFLTKRTRKPRINQIKKTIVTYYVHRRYLKLYRYRFEINITLDKNANKINHYLKYTSF